MIEEIKLEIKNYLENYYVKNYNTNMDIIVEEPKKAELGDIALPMFVVVKTLKKPMNDLTSEVKEILLSRFPEISEINVMGPFVNIKLDRVVVSETVIKSVVSNKGSYGDNSFGKGKTVVLDYSSPNIAKSFSIGHLRSTMIGNSLKLINQKCGYDTVGINYLGDWGTQFGKMIVAIKEFGDIDKIKADPINELTALYRLFHVKAEENPELEDKAREAFRQVELGNKEYLDMWKWIREESLKESAQIYDLLDVSFDSYNGEAFYNDKMDVVVDELEDKQLLVEDQGAMIVPLDDIDGSMPPALIKRKDGGTLYITRDLAAVLYRKATYNFTKALYVVGNEQKLHFRQLKAVLTKMGRDYCDQIEHVNFGLYLTGGKKMSTRSGKVVKLYDVLQESINLAYEQINEKNPDMENKDEIARAVGVGAIVFNDLKNHRTLDVDFNMEESVKFEGQTGPYLQYTGVRIASIINSVDFDTNNVSYALFNKPHYFELVKLLDSFSSVVARACNESAPSVVAKYLLSLAQSFNKFYSTEKINVEDEIVRNTNVSLAYSVRIILNEGLRLLGMKYLDRM